jgi:hypothetical protein
MKKMGRKDDVEGTDTDEDDARRVIFREKNPIWRGDK